MRTVQRESKETERKRATEEGRGSETIPCSAAAAPLVKVFGATGSRERCGAISNSLFLMGLFGPTSLRCSTRNSRRSGFQSRLYTGEEEGEDWFLNFSSSVLDRRFFTQTGCVSGGKTLDEPPVGWLIPPTWDSIEVKNITKE